MLRLVPAVYLIHEENGSRAMQPAPLQSGLDDLAQLGLSRQDRRDGFEMTLGAVGDDLSEGGLAGTRRTPQDDGGEKAVRLDCAPQQLARADYVFLSDVLGKGPRPHAGCKRRFALQAFLHRVIKQIIHNRILPFAFLQLRHVLEAPKKKGAVHGAPVFRRSYTYENEFRASCISVKDSMKRLNPLCSNAILDAFDGFSSLR